MVVVAVVTCGVGFGVGVGVLFVAAHARAGETGSSNHTSRGPGWMRRRASLVAVSLVGGLIALAVTRWPAAGILAALTLGSLPSVLRRTSSSVTTTRSEAIATWTESLRDALAASAGMGQAIFVTAPSAPAAIRPQVAGLAIRLSNGLPMAGALRTLAKDLDDPAAEVLVCALILAATSQTQRLTDVLTALAESMREDVAMRLKIHADRASARSSVRTIALFSLGFVLVLMAVARAYLQPFGTVQGQIVLLGVGLCYGGGLALMLWLVRVPRPMPLLDLGQL